MKKSPIILFLFAVMVACGPLFADEFATLENGLLTLGNDEIVWEFDWNDGRLVTGSLSDPVSGETLTMTDKQPDVRMGDLLGQVVDAECRIEEVEATAILGAHLQVEVVVRFESVDVRRVFRIHPDSSAIGCEFAIRFHGQGTPRFAPEQTVLQSFRPEGVHWNYRAVEFFDRTDQINNLVRETSILAYQSPVEMRGNVLLASNATEDVGFFIVKAAPCSFVQLQYPGYDFSCGTSGVQVVGMGLAPSDLSPDEWIPAYGVAVGVSDGTEYDAIASLRSYQKSLRRHIPERDDILMMNTWGDRNRDARIGEEFVNAQVDACERLGLTLLQIDDGWQQGLSKNSAEGGGKLWDLWDESSWQPHEERFPNGFAPVVAHAKEKGVDLGLWFHPSNSDDYANWAQDAEIVVNLYKNYGIRYFKIDGVKLPTKQAELNLRRFMDDVLDRTDGQVVFNLDATADNRGGYHYFQEYGNIFLENRYTDFGRYYPYWTLRNLWMLSKYVPPENLKIEFLNKWRNAGKYAAGDPLAPQSVPFDYQFAITTAAQPLAWFEGSELPPEGFEIAPVVAAYRERQAEFHSGTILPIGDEPSGVAWTGFQSVLNEREGYLLIFREYDDSPEAEISLYGLAGREVECEFVFGYGRSATVSVDSSGRAVFALPDRHTFVLYKYSATDSK